MLACVRGMLAGIPLAFFLSFDARTINQEVQRTSAATIRQVRAVPSRTLVSRCTGVVTGMPLPGAAMVRGPTVNDRLPNRLDKATELHR